MKKKSVIINMKPFCSICETAYSEFGNNAWPVNDGRCCDACNTMHVVPARIDQIRNRDREGS